MFFSLNPPVDHKLYSQLDYRTGRPDEYQGIQKQDSGSSNWTGGHSSEGSTWHSKSAENNPLLHFSYETMGHFSVPRDHAPVRKAQHNIYSPVKV